jgi:hypothetical protein
MSRRLAARAAQLVLLFSVAWLLRVEWREFRPPFDFKAPLANLRAIWKGHPPPPPPDPKGYDEVARAFDAWHLKGPLRISLPPGYSNHAFSNTVYTQSAVRTPEDLLLFSGDFPHPSIRVHEEHGDPAVRPYRFETRSANGAMIVQIGSMLWPFGYSAWRDLVTTPRRMVVPTPVVRRADGVEVPLRRVVTLTSLNSAERRDAQTLLVLRHQSPIVWEFDGVGALEPRFAKGYVVEEVAGRIRVSLMPPLPAAGEITLGLYLLDRQVAQTTEDAIIPAWWRTDEELRRQVLEGAPADERRRTLGRLRAEHPEHPLLDHYAVLADLYSPAFTATWLEHQRRRCDEPTWYLLPWTDVPLQTAETLPCYRLTKGQPVYFFKEYVDGAMVLRYRNERSPLIRELAQGIVGLSYLAKEPRGFNYVVSDYAKLWLDQTLGGRGADGPL